MTNGEKMQIMFPNAEIDYTKGKNDIFFDIDGWTYFSKEWWNEEYKEPTTKNDVGVDCISRAEVLKIFDEWFATCDIADKKASPKAKIKALPSARPKRPKGHWIEVLGGCKCSCCDMAFSRLKETCADNYCPNCGADMREVEK